MERPPGERPRGFIRSLASELREDVGAIAGVYRRYPSLVIPLLGELSTIWRIIKDEGRFMRELREKSSDVLKNPFYRKMYEGNVLEAARDEIADVLNAKAISMCILAVLGIGLSFKDFATYFLPSRLLLGYGSGLAFIWWLVDEGLFDKVIEKAVKISSRGWYVL